MQARTPFLSVLWAATFSLLISPALAQGGGGSSHQTPPPNPPPPLPRPEPSTFDQNRLIFDSNTRKTSPKNGGEDTCFLPPLSSMQSSTVAVTALQVTAKARKEYGAACAALRDQKPAVAEEHLRRAVQQDPKYPEAWVTLGQMLAARQQIEEARDACSQALVPNSSYLPPYLCLADIAAREQKWDEVLKLSDRALEIEPTSDAVAYGLNAAANLNLHQLPEAEKSALKALEIDKSNRDPRVHFLLAQIYEAKGDPANEAAQLREYLKFASDPRDAAMVKQYLSELEKRTSK